MNDRAVGRRLREEIRVLKYERLQNVVALVVAAACFAAEWLGEGLRLTVLRRMVAKLAKRFFGVPAFHDYALADGIRNVLARTGRWQPLHDDLAPPQPQPRQLLLFQPPQKPGIVHNAKPLTPAPQM